MEFIFQDLTQIDGSMTRRFGGLGLGLTLARRILKGMGGRLEVESAEGRGSIFRVLLPYGDCCRWD